MKRIKFYCAAAIRGQMGNDATVAEMDKNIKKAIGWAVYLREQLPGGEFFCPHEHEALFTEAWLTGLITSEQILRQSKAIVRLCDVVLVMTDPKYSDGVTFEVSEAITSNLRIVNLYNTSRDGWREAIYHHVGSGSREYPLSRKTPKHNKDYL